MLRSGGLRLICLGWLVVWFGVVAPGHERGVVTLPGMGCADRSSTSTDNQPAATCCAGKESETPDERVRRCAICQLLATLSPPAPPIVWDAPPTALLDWLPLIQPVAPEAYEPILSHRGRAPPATAA
jgi:hypothetical protein